MTAVLDRQVVQLCERHYGSWQPKVNGCHRCPIHAECTAGSRPGPEGLTEHIEKLNAAAARALAAEEGK